MNMITQKNMGSLISSPTPGNGLFPIRLIFIKAQTLQEIGIHNDISILDIAKKETNLLHRFDVSSDFLSMIILLTRYILESRHCSNQYFTPICFFNLLKKKLIQHF